MYKRQLRHLAAKHTVTLVSYVRPTDTPQALAHLRSLCAAVYPVPMDRARVKDARFLADSLLRSRSFILARDVRPAMQATLTQVLAEQGPFDAIHADQLWMAQFALRAAGSADAPPPLTVLDQHNACYRIFERLATSEANPIKRTLLAREARLLAREEVAACAAFNRVVWVTQEDADAVTSVAKELQLPAPPVSAMIPICGDPTTEAVVPHMADARRITFLGGLHYMPNAEGILWFARNIFPLVLAQAPDVQLTVIGKSPPEALHSLGIPPGNLHVTGYMDDPRPLLSQTAVFVVPLLAGGGMRVKIIDGWTWGLPIVSTTVGAEGIAVRPGENILLADEPADFAAAVLRLLEHTDERRKLAAAGRAWAEQRYGWRSVYKAWDAVYAQPERERA